MLKKAEETAFEVLITMDSNMTFQLNLAPHRLKIVVLRARSNRLADTILTDAKNLADSAHITNGTVTLIEIAIRNIQPSAS